METVTITFPNDENLDDSIAYFRAKLEKEGKTIIMEAKQAQGDNVLVTFSYTWLNAR